MSGIPPDVWAEQDWRTIITAADILNESRAEQDPEGRVMSG